MYEALDRIYRNTRNVLVLEKSVVKGWITEEQKEEIIRNNP